MKKYMKRYGKLIALTVAMMMMITMLSVPTMADDGHIHENVYYIVTVDGEEMVVASLEQLNFSCSCGDLLIENYAVREDETNHNAEVHYPYFICVCMNCYYYEEYRGTCVGSCGTACYLPSLPYNLGVRIGYYS